MGLTANKAELPALDNEIVSGNEETAIKPDVSHRQESATVENKLFCLPSLQMIDK